MIIRTQVAPEAIDKVTRLFNGSLTDIANELLQNARRAAASTIDITVGQPDDTGTTLTISEHCSRSADPTGQAKHAGAKILQAWASSRSLASPPASKPQASR